MERLIECVRLFRSQHVVGGCEMEIRMGQVNANGVFVPGVTREVFEQLERDLQESPELEGERKWIEMVDYHFTTSDNTNVRTRVEFDANRMEMKRSHVVKQTQSHVVVKRTEDDSGERCRIVYATEIPYTTCPGACIPTYVRVKQRRAFRDVRGGSVVWSYELARTWSAGSRSAVEHLQHMSEPVYEVECELVDVSGGYLETRSDETVAESMVLKAQLLLGEDHRTRVELEADKTGCESEGKKRGPNKRRRQNR